MLAIYWEIGHTICNQEKKTGWGSKVVERLARDLKIEFPEMTGFSPRNLRYMRDFSKAYPDFLILQPAAAKLSSANPSSSVGKKTSMLLEDSAVRLIASVSWTHQTIILDKGKAFLSSKNCRTGLEQEYLKNTDRRPTLRKAGKCDYKL